LPPVCPELVACLLQAVETQPCDTSIASQSRQRLPAGVGGGHAEQGQQGRDRRPEILVQGQQLARHLIADLAHI
jgi:hypothetical protein